MNYHKSLPKKNSYDLDSMRTREMRSRLINITRNLEKENCNVTHIITRNSSLFNTHSWCLEGWRGEAASDRIPRVFHDCYCWIKRGKKGKKSPGCLGHCVCVVMVISCSEGREAWEGGWRRDTGLFLNFKGLFIVI